MLTKCAALELAPLGVRVNAVAPSICDTNLYRYSGLTEGEYQIMLERAEENNPLDRKLYPEDVAKAIVFLSSDQAKRITGHVLKVDGGKSLTHMGSATHWYGTEVMNRRFEAHTNGVSKVKNAWHLVKEKLFSRTKYMKEGSDEWIAAKQTSNWATHSEEAHEKVKLDYGAYRIDNDQNLEYERANMWGGANNPARASNRFSYSRTTYGAKPTGYSKHY